MICITGIWLNCNTDRIMLSAYLEPFRLNRKPHGDDGMSHVKKVISFALIG